MNRDWDRKNSETMGIRGSKKTGGNKGTRAGARYMAAGLFLTLVLTGCGESGTDFGSLNGTTLRDTIGYRRSSIGEEGVEEGIGGESMAGERSPADGTQDREALVDESFYPHVMSLEQDFFIDFVMESEGIYCISGNKRGQESYYGYMTEDGKEIAPFIYEDASAFAEGLACVRLDGKYGFIDQNGETVIPFIYDYATPFSEGLAYFSMGDSYGFMDRSGEQVFSLDCDLVGSFSEGYAWFCVDGKYGYMNQAGETVIPPIYDDADFFRDGCARVRRDGKFGVIGKLGQEVVPAVYSDIDFEEGFIIARDGDIKYCFLLEEGGEARLLLEASSIYTEQGNGRKLLYFYRDGKAGLADCDGTILITPQYNYLIPLQDWDLAIAEIWTGEEYNYGLVDFQGNIKVPFGEYDSLRQYRTGYKCNLIEASIAGEDGTLKSGFLSLQDFIMKIPAIYDSVRGFQNGLAVVSQDGAYGIIDTEGNPIWPIEYKKADIYKNGAVVLRKEGSFSGSDLTYLYDATGELLYQSKQVKNIYLRGECYEIELSNGRTLYLSLDGSKKTETYDDPSTIYCIQPNIYVSSERKDSKLQYTLIKTDGSHQDVTDIEGAVLKSAVTPRIDLYYQVFLDKLINPTFGDTGVRQFYRLYLLDKCEAPILYYYGEPYDQPGFPLSESAFYQIYEEEAVEILSGYECGGSLRGDYATLWLEKKTGRILPGTDGSWGGFGGRSGGGSVYGMHGGVFKEQDSFYITWMFSASGVSSDINVTPELFYDDYDEPYSFDRMPGDEDGVTDYVVNDTRVTVEHYHEVRDRYEWLHNVWF